jgi:hypothetical protein
MLFLYVKIPVVKNRFGQSHKLEYEIDQILREKRVGLVAGWGGSLGEVLPDGSRPVAFTRIDVDVSDIAAARAILKTSLPALGAPAGTEIHCTMDERHIKDVFSESTWLLVLPIA